MPFDFTLLDDERAARSIDEIEVNGADISLHGGVMTINARGDLAVVTGQRAALQSVVRELPAPKGSLPRRPNWGGGLSAMLFKGATGASFDRMKSSARACLLVNPRIKATREISMRVDDEGTWIHVRADSIGGFIDMQTVIKPPGVK